VSAMALTAKPLYRYLIRKRGELLGSVEAPDEKAAIKAAIEKIRHYRARRAKAAYRSAASRPPHCLAPLKAHLRSAARGGLGHILPAINKRL